MKTLRILAAACVGALLAPSFANASPVGIINSNPRPLAGAPLQIESCIVSPTMSSPVQNVASIGVGFLAGRLNGLAALGVAAAGGTAVALASRNSYLSVRMSNEGSTAISALRIEIDGASAPVYERENLTLAPGDITTRTYTGASFSQNDTSRAVACRVDWVQFADGTTWSATSYQQGRTK